MTHNVRIYAKIRYKLGATIVLIFCFRRAYKKKRYSRRVAQIQLHFKSKSSSGLIIFIKSLLEVCRYLRVVLMSLCPNNF